MVELENHYGTTLNSLSNNNFFKRKKSRNFVFRTLSQNNLTDVFYACNQIKRKKSVIGRL